jgi:16S rRNA (guanine1207-N2)-methyltransferase
MAAFLPILEAVADRVRPPVAVVLGAPRLVAHLLPKLGPDPVTCYQMDLFAADRLREELAAENLSANVVTAPDLWDLPADFQTVVFPAAAQGERSLKIDMVEQAFHVLRPRGQLVVLSPFVGDELFPQLVKKVFGKCGMVPAGEGTAFLGRRDGDRPRRRHEQTFHAKIGEGPSLSFVSRPGVFGYGKLDDGSRAMLESMIVEPGDRVLDLGCGTGANGVFAGLRAGEGSHVTFLDSNLRAVALAELNAKANGLPSFDMKAATTTDFPPASFDLILANPPYFAQNAVAERFVTESKPLLKRDGRFYLVTKQPDEIGGMVADAFGEADGIPRRGYVVLEAFNRE